MDIKYEIKFYSYWHCGSGLAAGASMDAIVVKDSDGLPYVPGKTIKGLLRENVEEYSDISEEEINDMFGTRAEGTNNDGKKYKSGKCYFTNATLSEGERQKIIANKWQKFLYDSIAQTSIDDETGTAKEFSLRTTEVVIPCTLHGEIDNVSDGIADKIELALRMIKRLGVDRNRGLGRCDFIIIKGKEDKR